MRKREGDPSFTSVHTVKSREISQPTQRIRTTDDRDTIAVDAAVEIEGGPEKEQEEEEDDADEGDREWFLSYLVALLTFLVLIGANKPGFFLLGNPSVLPPSVRASVHGT